MRKLFITLLSIASITFANAQGKSPISSVTGRPGDHFMFQAGIDSWSGTIPDSIKSHVKSIGRGANVYLMLNKPFKTNPKMSIAFGVGVGTNNIYLDKMSADIKSTSTKLPFPNLDSSQHFKKYKISTAYLEVPLELRFTKDPANEGKSLKVALGVKVGTMLNAHTKGKTLLSSSAQTIGSYTEKESSKKYFNSTRLTATARIGLGHFSLYGNYQLGSLFKDGVAPQVKPLQIGLCISGL